MTVIAKVVIESGQKKATLTLNRFTSKWQIKLYNNGSPNGEVLKNFVSEEQAYSAFRQKVRWLMGMVTPRKNWESQHVKELESGVDRPIAGPFAGGCGA